MAATVSGLTFKHGRRRHVRSRTLRNVFIRVELRVNNITILRGNINVVPNNPILYSLLRLV